MCIRILTYLLTTFFNPVLHDVGRQEKCSPLEPPRDKFCKAQWAGQVVKINPIDVNFHLQKSLEIFEKNSADKIWSNKDKKIKMPPPPHAK